MTTKNNRFASGVAVGVSSCALLALVIGAASSQQAQTPSRGHSAPAAPIAAAGPNDAPAVAILDKLVGTWSAQGTATAPDGSTSGPFHGESQFGWSLGGNFLSGDHLLFNAQGAALQTIDVMGFTPGVGFTRSEITNGDRSMFLSTGMFDQAASALTFVTSNPMQTAAGAPRSLTTTFIFRPDGSVMLMTTFEENDQPAGSVSVVLTQTSKNPGLTSPQTPFGAPLLMQQGASGANATGGNAAGAAHGPTGSFIVQTPQGMAVTRPPQTMAENQQLMKAMMNQRQQMQAQMNTMQGQMQDMSRSMAQTAGD